MQEVQLYIENQRVDLFKDETINITQSIQNAKDPAKIFTDFTKSFTLPANKENNKIFQHYYNYDILGGFDARLKVSAEIKLNYANFRKGYLQLNGVDLKDNKPNIYRVTFFGETVNLKDVVGEDNLNALSWLDNFVVDYDSATVKTYLQAGYDKTVGGVTYTDAIITPLITHTDRLYYDSTSGHSHDNLNNLFYHFGSGNYHGVLWNQLKYSIRLHLIIKAIEQRYNIQFSTDFFNSSNTVWHNLYMWMHRKKGDVESGVLGDGLFKKIVDNFSVGGDFGISSNGTVIFSYPIGQADFTIELQTISIVPYNVKIFLNGSIVEQYNENVGNFTSPSITANDGNYTVEVSASSTVLFSSIVLEFSVLTNDEPVTIETETITATSVTISGTFSFYPTQQLPEIKVIDFLTGIFKMFNLTAYVEDDIIVVDTLDNFYASSNVYDITKFIDVSKSSVDVALPYKQIDFEYADYKTFLASIFNQLNAQQFGELKYKGSEVGKWVGDIYKIQLPFEKILYERLTNLENGNLTTIQYGYFTDDNEQPYIGKPLIHYANRQTGGTALSFRDTISTHSSVASYYIPLNQNGITTSVQSLHFGSEVNEYTLSVNNESLFENYYKEYIEGIFEQKRRLIKVTGYLPLRVLLNYNLSDTFIIGNKAFKINSIDTNLQTGESKMELLNDL